ncbi:MAG: HIT domain-containing protein [Haloferacaceae archaeon]
MDQVFAPWRIEWVEREDGGEIDGCPFCVLPAREADRENRIVARGEHSFVLLNNYPYNPGHLMIIPDDHVGAWGDLDEATWLDHARMKAWTFEALRAEFGPDGFNTGMNLGGSAAGGSIDDHLHTHVVPRWNGDTNFMPVVGDTKVIVEALADTYDRLHGAYADLDGAEVVDDDAAVRF